MLPFFVEKKRHNESLCDNESSLSDACVLLLQQIKAPKPDQTLSENNK